MQIGITNKFRKQVEKLKDKKLKFLIHSLIEQIIKAENLSEINNIKKLKGHNDMYRIRIGDYRIGLALKNKIVILAAFDHRNNIYKYFP